MKSNGVAKIIRGSERFLTRTNWLESRHSFSFGSHYDPNHLGHGLLIVSNDDVIRPGTGFSTHPHRDMEIVTWVLDGELEHKDSEGHSGVIYPGLAQRMSAGSGIFHSEMNPNSQTPVRLVQMWVIPDHSGGRPDYEQVDVADHVKGGGLFPIASGRRRQGAISLRQAGATLWGGQLRPGSSHLLPDAPFVHVYVAKGSADLEGAGPLHAGDAARLTRSGGRTLTPVGHTPSDVLVWESA